jgi:3-hydroxyisobutyrate dehydrogenase-like beta-hydroxyacid dehydrogenase
VTGKVAFIGFGEAGQAFATGALRCAPACAYDRLTDDPATRSAKLADFERAGVEARLSAADALKDASAIICVVTADQALPATQTCARLLTKGALWLDCNSVAPDTKRAAAEAIHAAGGRYVDVAVMSPVHPQKREVPLLVSGPHADAGKGALGHAGFSNIRIVDGDIGAASAIKMVRSVMVKGIEALSAECALAAHKAGVEREVIASLDASWPGADWAKRFDYNLDRMLIHGGRRAAEMEEVVITLDALGTGSAMSRSTVARQRALGALGRGAAPDGLAAKIALILGKRT